MKRMLWYMVVVSAAFFCTKKSDAAVIILGDENAGAHATTSVPLGAWAPSELNGHFYVGAHEAGAKNFAVAGLQKGAQALMPLTPEKAYIDGKADQPNPLYNAPIAHMRVHPVPGGLDNYFDTLLVVPAGKENAADLYVLEDCTITQTAHMELLPHILDACREPSSGIVALASTGKHNRAGIFAAVKPHDPSARFGDFGSGIALISMNTAPAGTGKRYCLAQVDTEPERLLVKLNPNGTVVQDGKPFIRAARCDKMSRVFAVNHALASLGDAVDLWWDASLKCLYIGVTATTGDCPEAYARSLAVAHIVGNLSKLVISPVVSDADCEKEQGILHCHGAHQTVATHFVRTMHTTTRLPYLITVGGMGRNSAYAFPLAADGTIKSPYQEQATIVGDGLLENGAITDIEIVQDTVFASVGQAAAGYDAGVFFSQALFDEQGSIKGWTSWQRAVADYSSTFGAFFDISTGFWTTLTGADAAKIMTLKQTRWLGMNEASCDIATVLGKAMPAEEGGVLGMYEFPELSLLVATGKSKIMLIKPELDSLMVQAKVTLDQKALVEKKVRRLLALEKQTKQSRVNELPEYYLFSGGALDALGRITCVEVVDVAGERQLWVGGMGGLAVSSLDKNDLVFNKVGSYKNVRKLVFDEGSLFVLTNQQLDRRDVVQTDFPAVTVAQAQHGAFKGVFSDVLISHGFALLATTNGLFYTEPLSDVCKNTLAQMRWKEIPLVSGGAVPTLFAITTSGKESDLACGCGGNVYALCVVPAYNTGSIYRLNIKPGEQGVLVSPIMVDAPLPGYLTELAGYRSLFVTDGALFMQADNRNLKQPPLCMSGIATRARGIHQLNIPLENACAITRIMRSILLGTWILSGDFGVIVNA